MTRMPARRAVLAAVLTGFLLATAPAGLPATAPAGSGAAPAAAAAPAVTKLVLTVTRTERSVPLADRAILTCQPPGGTHPRAAAACRQLARVDGHFARLAGTPGRVCTKEYNPVTAAATGTWKGRPVKFRRTFSNRCVLHAATGSVFRF